MTLQIWLLVKEVVKKAFLKEKTLQIFLKTKGFSCTYTSTKKCFVPLELTTAVSETDAAIQKKNLGSGMTTLTFSNEEINDIMKIVRCHEDAVLLIKNASETVENEVKKSKEEDFLVCCYIRCCFLRIYVKK